MSEHPHGSEPPTWHEMAAIFAQALEKLPPCKRAVRLPKNPTRAMRCCILDYANWGTLPDNPSPAVLFFFRQRLSFARDFCETLHRSQRSIARQHHAIVAASGPGGIKILLLGNLYSEWVSIWEPSSHGTTP